MEEREGRGNQVAVDEFGPPTGRRELQPTTLIDEVIGI